MTVYPMIGEVLQETYRVERELGKGSMGAVFEASHLRLARHFAIKVLSPAVSKHPEALARLRREAEIMSALGHPHIVEIVDFNHTADGYPYIVMELLEGEDLASRILRRGRISLEEAASIFQQISAAMQAAHERGVVHRDLKPQNIFLCNVDKRDDFVKVLDFGISKIMGSYSNLTGEFSLLGTPYYMSPEQAEEKASQVDLRTDIYTMGVILYQMLSGRLPFTGESVTGLLYKIVHEAPVSIRELCPELSPSLEAVLNQSMAKNRLRRYGSMEVFWNSFWEVLPRSEAVAEFPKGEALRGEKTEPLLDVESVGLVEAPTTMVAEGRRAMSMLPTEILIPSPPSPNHNNASSQMVTPRIHPKQVIPLSARTTLTSNRREFVARGSQRPSLFMILILAIAVVIFVSTLWILQRGVPSASEARSPQRAVSAGPQAVSKASALDRGSSTSSGLAGGLRLAPKVVKKPRLTPVAKTSVAPQAELPDPTSKRTLTRRLWLISKPTGAKVLMGKRLLGQSPLRALTIPVTKQSLRVQKYGYEDLVILLKPGQENVRLDEITLKVKFATLSVQTLVKKVPVAAYVYFDGKLLDQSPIYTKVHAGRHLIGARMKGYQSTQTWVKLTPGATTRVVMPLSRIARGKTP